MAKRKKTGDTNPPETNVTDTATEVATHDEAASVEPEPPAETKTKAAKGVTLEDICEGYLRHLKDSGKSAGTLFSYKLELVVAMEELGAKTKANALTPQRVLEFFECDRVMRTRSGVEKAPPTFLKTRRVLRQALVWAAETRLIVKAPLPEQAAAK